MPNPQSRFYAMQQTRAYSKWTKGYVRDVKRCVRRYPEDPAPAATYSDLAFRCAVLAAHWARLWKQELREEPNVCFGSVHVWTSTMVAANPLHAVCQCGKEVL